MVSIIIYDGLPEWSSNLLAQGLLPIRGCKLGARWYCSLGRMTMEAGGWVFGPRSTGPGSSVGKCPSYSARVFPRKCALSGSVGRGPSHLVRARLGMLKAPRPARAAFGPRGPALT